MQIMYGVSQERCTQRVGGIRVSDVYDIIVKVYSKHASDARN